MAPTCGVCGRSGKLLMGGPCALCGKYVCGSHTRVPSLVNQDLALHIMSKAPDGPEKRNLMMMTNGGQAPFMGVPICAACLGWTDYWGKDLYRAQEAAKRRYSTELHLEKAHKLERAGRFEDAAKEYEKAEAWDEAGRVRREGSTNVVKTVNVDLNRLMDDLRRGGAALNFKCNSCGGGITVGPGGVEPPSYCPYCGVMIDTKTLSDLLRAALR